MDNEVIRLGYYYLDLISRRPFYAIVPAIAVLAIGATFVFTMPRSYYAEALVVMDTQQIPSSLVESTVANERLQFIEQRVFARENLLALVNTFDLFPGVRSALSNTKLAELVRNHITIRAMGSDSTEQVSSSSTFTVGFAYGEPELTAKVVNGLVAMIINENRRTRTSRASETAQFLDREVVELTSQLKVHEQKWAKYMEENKDELPNRLSAYLIELQDRERDLAVAEKAIPDLDQELRLLEVQLQLNAPLANSTAAGRWQQLSALKTELVQKSSVYSEVHPEIRALKSQIEFLEAERAQLAAQPVEPAEIDYSNLSPELGLIAERIALAKPRREALISQRDQLQERVSWLKATIARAPEVEAELATLAREKVGIQRNLDDMRAKLETARLGERLEQDQFAAQIEVLEDPEVPRYANGPGRTKLMIVVLAIAGMVGFACVYLTDMLDRTVRGTFDLAESLKGQTLAVVPHWSTKEESRRRLTIIAVSVVGILICAAGGLFVFNQYLLPLEATLSQLIGTDYAWHPVVSIAQV